MSEISSLFESLYSHFLLRDIIAKVLPGLFGILAIFSMLIPGMKEPLQEFLNLPDLIIIVIVYGVSLLFGMILQFLASLFPCIKIHVWKGSDDKSSEEISLEKAVEFLDVAKDRTNLLRKRERLAILKEMSANYAATLVLVLISLLLHIFGGSTGINPRLVIIWLIIIGVVTALIFQNRSQAREQQKWEQEVIARLTNDKPQENQTAA
jgi:uncharacterized membrane protein